MRYPEVTISALAETGQEESSIIVPLQRAYTGRTPVIPSHLANTPCTILGVQGLLDLLNTTLGTTYTLDTPSLASLLEECITNAYDFGMAHSRLRGVWRTHNWSALRRREEQDRERRRNALTGNRVVDTDLPPRRVWDLYSNRVVPYWNMDLALDGWWPQPISHAWVDEKDRVGVLSPINGYEWPVPMPKDANLELIRIEMLNLGLEFVWLDVLCLRQVGGRREDLRAEEWKLDVPTIGAVYYNEKVVCYLGGLGRPLTLKEGDLESDRSWFRRAWTLQEVGEDRVIAGDTPDGPLHAECKDGKYATELLTRFHTQLQSTHEMWFEVSEALEKMQHRVSTNPVDRIAGLSFILGSESIPAYYESASLEEAWTALVDSMAAPPRGELFFLCPEPGNAGKRWRPSWDQVMMPLGACRPYPEVYVSRGETGDEDWCDDALCVEGTLRGLAGVDRRGELVVENAHGGMEHFTITTAHTRAIPEDTYTMIYACEFESSRGHGWVVGRSLPGGKFEKVATVEVSGRGQRRLEGLGVAERRRYVLV